MAKVERVEPLAEQMASAREELDKARSAVIKTDAQIKQKENEIQTAAAIGERDLSNIERQVNDAENAGEYDDMRHFQTMASQRRGELADRINQLESQLGTLKSSRIEAGAAQAAAEATLSDLKERADEYREREAVSEDQIQRATALEERLVRLESERSDLVRRIEEYAPVVEAQREAATASGSKELSEAYLTQADSYRDEWKRWLVCLGVAVAVALGGGVAVILLTHPSGDASNGEIISRVAIEILVLGLLVYAVRVTAHQFRVHRHLETVARGKAAALMTFNRLVAGPGEAEVRGAVAVALAQAVFDSSSTGFIDNSQDGVTLVERIVAPVAQRLSD